jgi:predicted 2-oxoglutarate/Fe(II)-dependent dioxygenase YbiX
MGITYSAATTTTTSPAPASATSHANQQALGFSHYDTSVIERIDLALPDFAANSRVAFVLRNVLTAAECQALIDLSEAQTYTPALVNVGFGREVALPDVRNNDRYIRDDVDMAGVLFERIRTFLPTTFRDCTLVELNERLRFLRYDPGQKFEPHMDGSYMRMHGPRRGDRSLITVQVYLNQGFDGGETTFLSHNSDTPSVPYVPEAGSVLIFEHRLLHEGSQVRGGRKYTIRTDVMYSRSGASNDYDDMS